MAEGETFTDYLNPKSLEVLANACLEPALSQVAPGARVQFERLGYFCAETRSISVPGDRSSTGRLR